MHADRVTDLERREIGTTDQFGLEDRYSHRVFPREWLSKSERKVLERMNDASAIDTGHRGRSFGRRAKDFGKKILTRFRIRRPR